MRLIDFLRKHLYADLQPYSCTFQECGLLLFEDRESWIDHEMETHRRRWICQICWKDRFTTRQALADHVMQHKETRFTRHVLDAFLDTCSLPMEKISASACKLCNWDGGLRQVNHDIPASAEVLVTARQLMVHLGRHLEQLALFALPRQINRETDSTCNQAGALSGASENSSRHLVSRYFYASNAK